MSHQTGREGRTITLHHRYICPMCRYHLSIKTAQYPVKSFGREGSAAALAAAFVSEVIIKWIKTTVPGEKKKKFPKDIIASISLYPCERALYLYTVAWLTKSLLWHTSLGDTSLDAGIDTDMTVANFVKLDVDLGLRYLNLHWGHLKIKCCRSIRHHSTSGVYRASYATFIVTVTISVFLSLLLSSTTPIKSVSTSGCVYVVYVWHVKLRVNFTAITYYE